MKKKNNKKEKITKQDERLLMWPPNITNPLWDKYVIACKKVGIEPGSGRWKYRQGTKTPIIFPKDGTKWIEQEDWK